MRTKCGMEPTNCASLVAVCIGVLFVSLSALSASGAVVGGNDIIARDTRDGAYNTTYVDMVHTIQSDRLLTGWNIWAQSYAETWPYSTDPRSLELIIFRLDGSDLEIVGKSGLETVSEWDRAYHFDLATPIQAQAGDLIGWYDASDTIPGGAISFGEGGLTAWEWTHGGEVSGITPLTDFNWAQARTYSINVEGSPMPSVPVPGAIMLGGIRMRLIGWLRRRRAI